MFVNLLGILFNLRINWAFKLLNNKEDRLQYNAILKQIELSNKTDSYIVDDSTLLSLSKDFSFDSQSGKYKRNCERCNGYLIVNKRDLNNLLENSNLYNKQQFILTLECDSCSHTWDMLIS